MRIFVIADGSQHVSLRAKGYLPRGANGIIRRLKLLQIIELANQFAGVCVPNVNAVGGGGRDQSAIRAESNIVNIFRTIELFRGGLSIEIPKVNGLFPR